MFKVQFFLGGLIKNTSTIPTIPRVSDCIIFEGPRKDLTAYVIQVKWIIKHTGETIVEVHCA